MSGVARRQCLAAGAAMVLALGPARAAAPELAAAVRRLTGDVTPHVGRVSIDLPELVENGNAVPVTIEAASPMTATDHVRVLALFTERNPSPEVAVFRLGPRAGLARVTTRIRLATSGRVVALAQMSDGSWWQREVDVLVTLAACIEG